MTGLPDSLAASIDPVEQMLTAARVARENDTMIPRAWVVGWAEQWQAERATQPPAVGVDVSEEMVERACAEWWGSDWGTWSGYQAEMKRAKARRILTAALRTGGGE